MNFDAIVEKIKIRGYWRVNFHPIAYNADLLSLENCLKIIKENVVSLRGWDYPHVPSQKNEEECISVSNNYYHAFIDWNGYKEYWRMYQSGQFLHYFALREDWDDENELIKGFIAPQKSGEFIYIDGSIVYQLTEIYEFLSRLVLSNKYDSNIFVSISLHNTKDRMLRVGNRNRAPFHNSYKSGSDTIEFSSEYSKEQLIEKPDCLALETALFFFDRFTWHNPPMATIKQDQAELLSGLY